MAGDTLGEEGRSRWLNVLSSLRHPQGEHMLVVHLRNRALPAATREQALISLLTRKRLLSTLQAVSQMAHEHTVLRPTAITTLGALLQPYRHAVAVKTSPHRQLYLKLVKLLSAKPALRYPAVQALGNTNFPAAKELLADYTSSDDADLANLAQDTLAFMQEGTSRTLFDGNLVNKNAILTKSDYHEVAFSTNARGKLTSTSFEMKGKGDLMATLGKGSIKIKKTVFGADVTISGDGTTERIGLSCAVRVLGKTIALSFCRGSGEMEDIQDDKESDDVHSRRLLNVEQPDSEQKAVKLEGDIQVQSKDTWGRKKSSRRRRAARRRRAPRRRRSAASIAAAARAAAARAAAARVAAAAKAAAAKAAAATMTVTIGSSGSNTKIVSVPAGLSCPSQASKNSWAGPEKHGDRFAISQTGTTLVARRTDSRSGWGMNLKIRCSRSGSSGSSAAKHRHTPHRHTTSSTSSGSARLVKVNFAAKNALDRKWSKQVTLAKITIRLWVGPIPIALKLWASGGVSAQFSANFQPVGGKKVFASGIKLGGTLKMHASAAVDIGVASAGIEGEATLIHGSVIALGSANLAVNAGEEQNELEIDSSAAIITDVLKPCEMRPCVPVCKTAIQNKFGQSHQASLCKADPACLKHNQECTESIKRQQKRAESTLNEAMRPHMPQPLGGGSFRSFTRAPTRSRMPKFKMAAARPGICGGLDYQILGLSGSVSAFVKYIDVAAVAKAAGKAIVKGAKVVGKAIAKGAKVVGKAVSKGVKAVGKFFKSWGRRLLTLDLQDVELDAELEAELEAEQEQQMESTWKKHSIRLLTVGPYYKSLKHLVPATCPK